MPKKVYLTPLSHGRTPQYKYRAVSVRPGTRFHETLVTRRVGLEHQPRILPRTKNLLPTAANGS